MAWGQGLKEAGIPDPGNPTLSSLGAVLISPKTPVCLVWDALEVLSVPFVQHYLIGFLLTLSHCGIVFC